MIKRYSQKGIAMVAALGFMVIVTALIGTLLVMNVSNKRLTAYNKQSIQAQFAAEAGVDQAILTFWHTASSSIDTAKGVGYKKSVEDYRDYWDNLSTPLESAVDANQVPIFGTPVTLTGTLVNGATYQVEVSRKDIGSKSTLQMVSTSNLGNETTKRLQQEFSVDFPPFELDFALLTDVINCTLCHAAFTSIEAAYDDTHGDSNSDFLVDITNATDRQNAALGTERIRLAALKQLLAEPGGWRANTLIGGTVYTRGSQNIICTGGEPNCKPNVFGPSYQVSNDNKVLPLIAAEPYQEFRNDPQNPFNQSEETLHCTGNGNNGCAQTNARGYTNYPKAKKGQIAPIDGVVPDAQFFPSPIPDTDGNRLIDNNEWSDAISNTTQGQINGAATLLLSPTDVNGNIQAGGTDTFTFNNVSPAPVIDDLVSYTSLTPSNSRGIAGNLILIGTDTNPIQLNGKVYVDGDIVIAGYIAPGNEGVLVARRNIYIVGDLLYDCNGSSSGRGCTYYDPSSLPRLAMASAGVMIIGDYTFARRAADNNTFLNAPGGFTNSAIFAEVMNFNQTQVSVSPPRFYAWQYRNAYTQNYSNLPVCTANGGECRGYFNTSMAALTTTQINSAAIIPLSPFMHWLAPSAVRSIANNDVNAGLAAQNVIRDFWAEFVLNNPNRPQGAAPEYLSSGRRALRIDGLLYSNNAIFSFFQTSLATHGSLTINGSIIAYEVGILTYGNASGSGNPNAHTGCAFNQSASLFLEQEPSCVGLQVNYDKRLPSLLEIRDTEPELHSVSFEWQSVN